MAATSNHVRGKSVDSSTLRRIDSRTRRSLIPSLNTIRYNYLIGEQQSSYDWESWRMTEEQLKKMPYKLRKFYERQNELIERYAEIDALLGSDITQNMIRDYSDSHQRRERVPANIDEEGQMFLLFNSREDSDSAIVSYAIIVNFLINIFLLGGKFTIVILTNSISLIASLVDSVLDFLCTAIIWISTSLIGSAGSVSRLHYPVGKARLEPLGVLIFSVIIIISFFQVAIEAVQRLWNGPHDAVKLDFASIGIMTMAVVLKLFAWAWCRTINSSAIQALAQDAMSDITFNLLSMFFPMMGHLFDIWWLDPLGALLLAIYIIRQWIETTFEHVQNLTGVAADPIEKHVIIYLCSRFATGIKRITSLNVYHVGDRYQVDVDIIVNDKMNLQDSHDLGEALQYAIETLPTVERAYVHIDYRQDNFAGHLLR
ncbi:cation efflux family-domain-containing protein [Dipodascopsis uninucleata]